MTRAMNATLRVAFVRPGFSLSGVMIVFHFIVCIGRHAEAGRRPDRHSLPATRVSRRFPA